MNKLFSIILALSVLVVITEYSSSAKANGISLSQKDTDYAVAKDDAAAKTYIYGRLDNTEGNVPATGNPCDKFAFTNINLKADYVTTGSSQQGGQTVMYSERHAPDVPGSCEDIGYCVFRCIYLNKDLDSLKTKLVGQFDHFVFVDRSKDETDKLFYGPKLAPGRLDTSDPDADADLVPDVVDNCPQIKNFDQIDTDQGQQGDACKDTGGTGSSSRIVEAAAPASATATAPSSVSKIDEGPSCQLMPGSFPNPLVFIISCAALLPLIRRRMR